MRQNKYTQQAISVLGLIEFLGLIMITIVTIMAGVIEVNVMITARNVCHFSKSLSAEMGSPL
jgi:hypothetical protein